MTNPNQPSTNTSNTTQTPQAGGPNRVTRWLYGATFGNLGKIVQDTGASIFNVFNGGLFDEFDQFGKDVKNRFGGKSFFGKVAASPGLVKDVIMFGTNSIINKIPLVNGKGNYRNTIWTATKNIASTLAYPIARTVKPYKKELEVTLK